MASVQLRGKYYSAKFRGSDGKQRCVSTKLTNEKAAQKLAEEWEAASRSDVVAKQEHKVVSDMLAAMGHFTPVGQFVDGWFKGNVQSWKPSTLYFNQLGVSRLLAFLGPRVAEPMNQISKSDLAAYRESSRSRAPVW